MVFPIMEMRRLSVGQDLANLNTLSWGGGDDGDGGGGGGDGDGGGGGDGLYDGGFAAAGSVRIAGD